MEVRPARPGDRDAIDAVVRDAFADEEVIADLVVALREAGAVEVELVAVEAGEVVGHVALERAWVDAEEALAEVLVLSPLGVARSRRGAGIGTRLLGAALARPSRSRCSRTAGSPAGWSTPTPSGATTRSGCAARCSPGCASASASDRAASASPQPKSSAVNR